MVVTTGSFLSDSILFLRNVLCSNVSDPLTSRTGSFIFTSYPKSNTVYPIITIKNTGIATQKLGMSSETSLSKMKYEVKVFSKNSKECDNLTQNIINVLRTNQFGTNSTNEEQVFGFNIDSVVPIVSEDGINTIHQKAITFTYKIFLGN
jgi:hypothetical protein